ncbi:amidase [Amylibacter marinus]|uniref:Amidase n=1 Tax=Amylibacter marinus TaxID=1475483 RepID=A0ABQ5VW66_9RHOB|nr:amidase family protein [Amylibacter marinus]GLQ35417.1 amidase [Amylibacter marinus]
MVHSWLTATACDLGRGIENNSICPLELTNTFLSAIQNHPQRDRIYSIVTADRALKEASAAKQRAQSNTRRGLLDGVPISWKDLFDSADIPTEAGCRMLAGRVPDTDAVPLRNATDAGMICLGKTHMSELAFSGLGLNPMAQTTPCVNDLDAVAGGSSSGAAGSVAFGIAAAGIGSDTGGSVRIPSTWNDLVGLKTTSAEISLEGSVPLCPKFDTVGPLCRSVEDASALFDVLRGRPITPLHPQPPKRALILNTIALDDVDTAPKSAFDKACGAISESGIETEEIAFPELNEIMALAGVLFTTEAYAQWAELLETEGHKMYPMIFERFMSGKAHAQADYRAAWDVLRTIRQKWDRLIGPEDVVVLPSSPILPPKTEGLLNDHAYYIRANLLALRNTRIGNLLNLPVVTLPLGAPSCGISIMGKPHAEAKLLQHCAAIDPLLTNY